jgi:hypothetical protein
MQNDMMDILRDIECNRIWYESETADAEAGNAKYEVVLERFSGGAGT